MKITCGTDIIEIDRIKKSIEQSIGKKFIETIYSEKEQEYCESKKKQKYQHYAARFAAKEATYKAISKEIENKYSISWKNIEVENDNQGRPKVSIIGKELEKIMDIDISISHCKEYAVANVVVLWREN